MTAQATGEGSEQTTALPEGGGAATMSREDELDVLIRARYPLLYIVSWEEQRVEALLRRICVKRSKHLYGWSVTEGIYSLDGPAPSAVDPSARDPMQALDYIAQAREAAVFVLKDFHPFIDDSRPGTNNVAVIRKLRDIAAQLKGSHKTVALLAPVLRFPIELEKEITVCDYALPGIDELDVALQRVIGSVRGSLKLELSEAERQAVLRAAQGLTTGEAENAFARSIVLTRRLDVGLIAAEKEQIIRRSQILEYYSTVEGLDDVGGLDQLKIWLRKRGLAFSEEARRFGLPEPRGVLLLGVQGGGKSLVAKAVASLWKLPLLKLDLGKIFSEMVGSSEGNMRAALNTAESVAPCILWLDELDKGLAGISSSGRSDAGTTARVFGSFLTWMQEKTLPVFVIATANNVTSLPPEAIRKGRFDEIFFVDLPNPAEREVIFAIHLRKRRRNPELYNLSRLADAAHGFSGAEIEQAIISALYDAFDAGRDMTDDDIARAIRTTVPLSTSMREDITNLRTWARARARYASTTV